MPFTPFHFGVGFLAKGALPERVSLSAFVASQVIIDCETAYYLMQHDWPVHRWCHTFLIGPPVGLLAGGAVWAGWLLLGPFLRNLRGRPGSSESALWPSLLGGFIGGATHPLLDGIMHWDVKPLWPFRESNPLLHALSVLELHALCLALAAVGVGLLVLRGKVSSLYVVDSRKGRA
jgi:hypothetical protein